MRCTTYKKIVEKFLVEAEILESLFLYFPYTLSLPEVRHCDCFTKTNTHDMKLFFWRRGLSRDTTETLATVKSLPASHENSYLGVIDHHRVLLDRVGRTPGTVYPYPSG